MVTIAIDYDQTITDDTPFPYTGAIRPEARKYIDLLSKCPCKLVLWTARKGKYYQECIERLKKENLYHYFNWDINETGKIEANYYIDDRAYFREINWKQIYEYIVAREHWVSKEQEKTNEY